jgi:hypothetical protein
VTTILRNFLESGMSSDLSLRFHPKSTSLRLYLHGRAGIGKSEFIRVFSLCLSRLLQKYFDSSQNVNVVKVPLNSMTSRSLASLALVKGISDYSIERLCEQALVKGHIVLLHLEENPVSRIQCPKEYNN